MGCIIHSSVHNAAPVMTISAADDCIFFRRTEFKFLVVVSSNHDFYSTVHVRAPYIRQYMQPNPVFGNAHPFYLNKIMHLSSTICIQFHGAYVHSTTRTIHTLYTSALLIYTLSCRIQSMHATCNGRIPITGNNPVHRLSLTVYHCLLHSIHRRITLGFQQSRLR